MNISGNSILITGGGSGIGFAMAKEFAKLGNDVIVAGRNKEKLATAGDAGLKTMLVDMLDAKSIKDFAAMLVSECPSLNVVIHNAGIMAAEDIKSGDSSDIEDKTIITNLLGPIRLTDALLPHLLKQKSSTIMTVTSGLAFVPLAMFPSYCATKAALHSYTESLRYQLSGTSVAVVELPPPYVQTELTGAQQASDPNAMPLDEFINEVFDIMKNQPNATEILVERVLPLRNAAYAGQEKYNETFKYLNEVMAALRK